MKNHNKTNGALQFRLLCLMPKIKEINVGGGVHIRALLRKTVTKGKGAQDTVRSTSLFLACSPVLSVTTKIGRNSTQGNVMGFGVTTDTT